MPKTFKIPTIFMLILLVGCQKQTKIAEHFAQQRQNSFRQQQNQLQNPQDHPAKDLPWLQGEFSLEQCIAIALQNNNDIKNAHYRLAQADGQYTEALATALPKASLNFDALNVDTAMPGDGNSYSAALELAQPLYLGGLIGTALDAAKTFDYLTAQELKLAIQQVYTQVQIDYLEVLLTKHLVLVAQQELENSKELLNETQKKYQFGTARKFDVLRSEVRLKALEAELLRQQNSAQIAKTILFNAMGIAPNSKIALTDQLEYIPINIDTNECNYLAMTQKPELMIAEANIRLAQNNLQSKQAGNKPNLYLVGSYQRSYPGFKSFMGEDSQWDRQCAFGLRLNWPFFNGFAVKGQVAQARALLQQRRIDLVKAEQKIQLELQQALLNLQNSENFIVSQDGNMQNAQESLRLVQADYRNGLATSLDVIEAQLHLSQAQKDYYSAVQAWQVALIRLHWAIGTIGHQPLPTTN